MSALLLEAYGPNCTPGLLILVRRTVFSQHTSWLEAGGTFSSLIAHLLSVLHCAGHGSLLPAGAPPGPQC